MTAVQRSSCPDGDGCSVSVHSGVSPNGRSNSDRTCAPPSTTSWAAARTSGGATSGPAITDVTASPSVEVAVCTATSPAALVVAMNARCERGDLSTWVSRAAHGLAAPSSAAGASSNAVCQDTLVASADASTSTTRRVISIGNVSISPIV